MKENTRIKQGFAQEVGKNYICIYRDGPSCPGKRMPPIPGKKKLYTSMPLKLE
jgi:hypothetical protein